MKEIGGYFELDTYSRPMLHENAIALNCGRNALAFLIEARNIKKICLPYFLCNSVIEVCKKYSVSISFYHIGIDFMPERIDTEDDEWFYFVNYYGQIGEERVKALVENHKHVIVDNAQNYFARPLVGVDTIYSCRKYFGVADGAFLCSDAMLDRKLPVDESFNRMRFVLGRFERTASEFYAESSENNKYFRDEPIKQMSKLTKNLLHAINYEDVRKQRTDNFNVLMSGLNSSNSLNISPTVGAFMYPYLVKNADRIKSKLLEKNIYIPTLWPNIVNELPHDWIEWKLANGILPLPCDQRYNTEDMESVIEEILKCQYK